MASSYCGDPWNFRQTNNPFLEMMAAIDGPGDDVQQQQQQVNTERRSGNIKLPDFWPAAPAIWFARAELRFEVAGILSEREKFAHAVNALPQDATRLVTDLIIAPPADRPYKALKERLLLSHQLSPVQKAAKVLGMPAIGDRRPSQLLADLLEYCPLPTVPSWRREFCLLQGGVCAEVPFRHAGLAGRPGRWRPQGASSEG